MVLPVLIRKEFTQFRRNAFLPKLLIALPMMVMFVMPWVMTMDVRHIGVAIIDHDHSSLSQRLISHVSNSDYFSCANDIADYQTALERLDEGYIDVIISIPEHWEKEITNHKLPITNHQSTISIVANAVNANKGMQGMQYAMQIIGQTMRENISEQGISLPGDLITVENRYNPTSNYRYFMIPALMIIILILLCCFLPALNIVSEKETGTIEQINVTPVSKLEFTLSKLIPYWIMGLGVLTVAMLIAWLVYGLVPVGSLGTIYLGAVLLIGAMSGFGVTLANLSDNMQQTVFLMLFFVMQFMLMSGLLTPISSMPRWAEIISYAFPPRYFIDIMRAVYLKGTTLLELSTNFFALGILVLIMNALATLTYKKQS